MAEAGGIPTYKCDHKYRGCAIIIVNKNFWVIDKDGKKVPNPKLKRKGSTVDIKKMETVFKALDFKVKVYKDLTAESMKDKIYKASQNEDFNQKSDSFALVISSHGEEVEEKKVRYPPKGATIWRHCVLGSDNSPLFIDDMISYFQDDKAKGLTGKPKLFFIQACRSRHGFQHKRFDYGVNINVSVGGALSNIQPSDAGDRGDDALLDSLDCLTEIEDIYKDCIDDDDEEWKGDQESGSSDDEDSIVDSDEDISDARGDPDSGYMPPSPDMDLPNPLLPAKDDKGPTIPVEGSQDTNIPQEPPGDEADVKHSQDTGVIRPSPFDIVPIKCPEDCLLVYPAMSGNVAFRRADLGSRLLHCMHKEENLQKLVRGRNLLQYLTDVSGDMARVEINFEPDEKVYTKKEVEELKKNMPFKVKTVILHRLQKQLVFEPKTKKSIMAAVLKKFQKMYI
ncbi:uncharacterized protein LOC123566401 [Mercenaria mercenaria]|uniref:uncharacterized protein LOC123566401 n=1 Tax=Mercenaria mercenaria TaxID=6596 RepID=UPI00234FB53B|nr:uncharacterized protein LOC123566401 [Mercenaria mercenaria]